MQAGVLLISALTEVNVPRRMAYLVISNQVSIWLIHGIRPG
jgi:hypothetical protein